MKRDGRVISFLGVGIFLSFLSGCSSVRTTVSRHRFDTPEVRTNGFAGRLGLSVERIYEVEVVPYIHSTPPTLDSPKIASDESRVFMNGALSVSRKVEFFLKGPTSSGGRLGIKYQFLGVTEDLATQGDFSLSATAARWGISKSGSREEKIIGTDRAEVSNASSSSDFAVIAGYRVDDRVLVYGGPFYNTYDFDTHIKQTSNNDAEYSVGAKGSQVGGNLGVSYVGTSWAFMAEGVFSRLIWHQSNTVEAAEWSFGINLTKLFGGASEEDREKRKEELKKERSKEKQDKSP